MAVAPPEEVVEHLEEFLAPRREHRDVRWSPAEQLHLTLAFYESVPDHALDDLVEALGVAAGRRHRFPTRIVGGGAFPDAARARVLYAGLGLAAEDRTELDRLSAGSRTAAGRSGVVVDGRRFRPHVTLARLGSPVDVTRWLRVLDSYDGPSWTVDHVALVASYLGEGPGGRPRYETVAELPLG